MATALPAEDRARRGPDRRIVAAGVLLAAAAGAWAGQRLQEPSRVPPAEPPPLIDWRTARDIAVTMSRDEALPMADRRKLDAEYRALVARCVPIVSEYTGDHLPDAPERTFAFDRVDWVNANIDAFERMFAPLEGLNLLGDAANRSIAGQMLGTLNQKVLSAEVGLLLGYLARKSAEGEIVTGLLFVDPDASDLHDAMNTVDCALNKLEDAELIPPLSALEKINASLR